MKTAFTIMMTLLCVSWGKLSYSTPFKDLGALVERDGQDVLKGDLAFHVRPEGAKAVENVVRTYRAMNGVAGLMRRQPSEDILVHAHPRFFSSSRAHTSPREEGHYYVGSYGEALLTHLFPLAGEPRANSISRNDPFGKINRHIQGAPKKNDATIRLAHIIRTVWDALNKPEKSANLVDDLMNAFNQKPISAFDKIPSEAFAQYEILCGMEEQYKIISKFLRGLSESDVKECEESLDSGDPITFDIFQTFKDGRDTFEWCVGLPFNKSLSSRVEPEIIQEFSKESAGKRTILGHKVNDKILMALRKRQLSLMISRAVAEDLNRMRDFPSIQPYSVTLSGLMHFFWSTYDNGEGLKLFYETFLGQTLDWDETEAEQVLLYREIRSEINELKKNPQKFADLSFVRQVVMLELESSVKMLNLPTSGVAQVGSKRYSDCVESTIRGALLHALFNEDTMDFDADKLPDTSPMKEYFKHYTDHRMTQQARNAWGGLTQSIAGVEREIDEDGYAPSVENAILALQYMMEDQEQVVIPVDTEVKFEEAKKRYSAFLNRFSTWLSARLGRPVSFKARSDLSWTDGRRTTGKIDLFKGELSEDRLQPDGILEIDPGHGEYAHEGHTSPRHRMQTKEFAHLSDCLKTPGVCQLSVLSSIMLDSLVSKSSDNFLKYFPLLEVRPQHFSARLREALRTKSDELFDFYLKHVPLIYREREAYSWENDNLLAEVIASGSQKEVGRLRQVLKALLEERPEKFDRLTCESRQSLDVGETHTYLTAAAALGLGEEIKRAFQRPLKQVIVNMCAQDIPHRILNEMAPHVTSKILYMQGGVRRLGDLYRESDRTGNQEEVDKYLGTYSFLKKVETKFFKWVSEVPLDDVDDRVIEGILSLIPSDAAISFSPSIADEPGEWLMEKPEQVSRFERLMENVRPDLSLVHILPGEF